MFWMRYAAEADLTYWRTLDAHISREELQRKILAKRCYLLLDGETPVGIMRYNLFWDSIPFLTLICFEEVHRGKGYGKAAMAQWEAEMRALSHPCVMTSTQADETAQFFYRKQGYKDAGCLVLDLPSLAQPLEIFLIKAL